METTENHDEIHSQYEQKLEELEIYSNSIFKNVINEYEILINENSKT